MARTRSSGSSSRDHHRSASSPRHDFSGVFGFRRRATRSTSAGVSSQTSSSSMSSSTNVPGMDLVRFCPRSSPLHVSLYEKVLAFLYWLYDIGVCVDVSSWDFVETLMRELSLPDLGGKLMSVHFRDDDVLVLTTRVGPQCTASVVEIVNLESSESVSSTKEDDVFSTALEANSFSSQPTPVLEDPALGVVNVVFHGIPNLVNDDLSHPAVNDMVMDDAPDYDGEKAMDCVFLHSDGWDIDDTVLKTAAGSVDPHLPPIVSDPAIVTPVVITNAVTESQSDDLSLREELAFLADADRDVSLQIDALSAFSCTIREREKIVWEHMRSHRSG